MFSGSRAAMGPYPAQENRIMKGIVKVPVVPARVRRVPASFSWVDHRLVREGHVNGRSHAALALYLFLVTVADAQGLSYWSEKAVAGRLRLELSGLRAARAELEAAGLVAYEAPLWQVLELPGGAA
jgi:hypothetical protein